MAALKAQHWHASFDFIPYFFLAALLSGPCGPGLSPIHHRVGFLVLKTRVTLFAYL